MTNRVFVYLKSAVPVAGDDVNSGYLVGDRWVDETNDNEYVCVDNTVDAAVWPRVTFDEWIPILPTLTYATANTFTVAGDQTAIFRRGVKLKFTQTTEKFMSVYTSSYSAPNTTVTVTGGSDYTLANAAIVSPYYSIIENPSGFPAQFSWTPTFTGFSAGNNPVGTHKFSILSYGMFVDIQHSSNGTSDAVTFYMTAPPGVTLPASAVLGLVPLTVDNGAVSTTKDDARTDSNGTRYELAKAANTSGWTAANGKRCRFTLVHALP